MIIRGKSSETESVIDVQIENGKVLRVSPSQKRSPYDFGGDDLYLCSGFFDPQVNGCAGVDFNSSRLSPDGLHRAAAFLASTGVTRFLPTLITSSHEKTLSHLKIIANALKEDPLLLKMCIGIHLEGPFISPEEGPRGVHPKEFIRVPNWEEIEKFQKACGGRIRCVTLAPEVNGAIPFIMEAVGHGMVAGIGHTNADEDILEQAVDAGARLFSHLGNASPKKLVDATGPIKKHSALDQLIASIIVDGIHLPPQVAKDYVWAKGVDRIVLTTDSMAGAGAPPGRYTLGDLEVDVSSDGAARLAGTSRLAGSTLTMDRAITNVIRFAGLDLRSAIRTAGKNGQKLFPEAGNEIVPGHSADLVLFEYHKELVVRSAWIGGEKIF